MRGLLPNVEDKLTFFFSFWNEFKKKKLVPKEKDNGPFDINIGVEWGRVTYNRK